jgi:hypothetical protein
VRGRTGVALGQLGPDALHDAEGLVTVEPGQHDHEFLSAPAGDQVVLPQRAPSDLGEESQRTVTCLMAVGAVERLEVIEVRDHDRRQPPVVEHGAYLALGRAAIEQSGQAVRRRLELALLKRPHGPDPRAGLGRERRELIERLSRGGFPSAAVA